MKKIIILNLALILALSLAACGDMLPATSGSDPAGSRPTGGESSNSPGNTSDPTSTPDTLKPTDPTEQINNPLSGTVWSKYPDEMDWWYGKFDGIEKIIPRERSYANSWIFNTDGTFVMTMRWLINPSTLIGVKLGGVLVTYGNYQIISDTQFILTNMKTNRTSALYYGDPTGWHDEKTNINCEYAFFTDSDGDGIKIKMDGVGYILDESLAGFNYDNTWDNFWKRIY